LVFRPELSWEFLSSDEIDAKSIRAVRNHVRHVKEVSAFYRETLFDIFPEDIKSLADIARLPFTEKETLIDRAPSFRAVSEDLVVESMASCGATGKRIIFPLTAVDLERLEFNEALSFYSAGVSSSDRGQLFLHFDQCLSAGIAYYRGLTHLGVNSARTGMLSAEMHKQYFDLLQPTILIGAPSFFKKLAAELAPLGFDKNKSSIRKLFCFGENIRTRDMQLNDLGKALEAFYNAAVFSTYGSTEISSSFCECEARCGGHGHPELVYTEIVDEKGTPVPDGTVGELVATPLGVEGNPLVRYKTGDITFKIPGKCPCGRNSMRIGPIVGQLSQMVKMQGAFLYPSAVATILDGIDGIEDYLIILENDEAASDRISLHIITPPNNMEKISGRMRSELHVTLPLLISNAPTLRHLRGKTGRETKIIDIRKRGGQPGARSRG
jgi:phenylacetate-CoA ligase